jgi:hypothetical protein
MKLQSRAAWLRKFTSGEVFSGRKIWQSIEAVPCGALWLIIQTPTSSRLVIDLPDSFVNQRVEVLVVTLDESEAVSPHKRRVPPPQFAGKVKELGDVFSSVPLSDWGIEE